MEKRPIYCDWCSSEADYRVTWTGTQTPPHERPACCTPCSVHPERILAEIGMSAILVVVR